MPTRFQFRTAAEIRFGAGEIRALPEIVARFGRRVLLVTGVRSADRLDLPGRLHGFELVHARVDGEPDVEAVDRAARSAREARCEAVVGVGGGSALDAAKAAAAMAVHDGSVRDYLEDVGDGRSLSRPPLPFVAVPTTAGSGSEATRNAVIRVPDRQVKRSLRHDALLPRVALIDPQLSGEAPRAVAASAGLDALTHLLEAYVSTGAHPTTDALAVPGARRAFDALRALADGRSDAASNDSMALASLWGGIALANAGLGAVHGLVAPLGGRCRIAHGNACACLLDATLAANLAALRARAPSSPALARYEDLARALGVPSADALPDALGRLRRDLGVPSLGAYGVKPDDLPAIVRDSRGSSMKTNPIVLTDAELTAVLAASL
ncbi:MAG TPA: iron-containing alcohol dehydrogenase [Planctomycetota bacterium]|nr:iron-containing alcohol dehydrogenase [Planctomycetota bacterium]